MLADCADHDGDGESVSGGDAKQPDTALAGGAEILISADGADTDEDQREGADEFGK